MDRLLDQYAEGELDEPTRRRLQNHLGDCPSCLKYVATYRRIVFLTGAHSAPSQEMPPELERKFHAFIETNPLLR